MDALIILLLLFWVIDVIFDYREHSRTVARRERWERERVAALATLEEDR